MVDESSDKKGSNADSEKVKSMGKETSEEMPSSAETPEIPIAGAEESRYEERTPDALSLISDLREGGRYRGIMNAIKDLRTSMDDKIHSRLKAISEQKLGKAKRSLEVLEKETGRKFEDLWDVIELSEKAIRDNDYNSVESFLDVFARTKEMYQKRFLSEKYQEEIEKARSEISTLLKAGIELPELSPQLISAERELAEERFDGVKTILGEISKIIEEANTVKIKNMARSRFSEVKETFDRLKNTGMELFEEKTLFRDAMLSIKSKNYLEGCILLQRTSMLLEKADRRRSTKLLNSQLEEHKRLFTFIEEQGYFSDNYRGNIRDALEQLDTLIGEGRTTEAEAEMKVFRKIMSDLNETMEQYEKMNVLSEDVENLIGRAEELELDVVKEKQLMAEARTYKKMDNIEEALVLVVRAKEQIHSKLEKKHKDEAELLLKEAKTAIYDNRSIIEDPSLINIHMLNANTYFAQRKYEHSIKTATKIIQMIEQMKEKHHENELLELFEEAENVIGENREKGLKVFECEALFYKAKFYFEQNIHEQANKYARSSIECALRDRTESQKKSALRPLTKAQDLMKEVLEIRADATAVTGLLESAQNYFDNGKFQKAEEWAKLASAEMEKVIEKKQEIIIKESHEDLDYLINMIAGLEVDISKERDTIKSLETLMKDKNYLKTISSLNSIKRSLKDKIMDGTKKKNIEKIEKAEKELKEFQEKWGKEFQDLVQYLDMVRAALQEGSYDVLDEYLEELEKAKERHNNLLLALKYTEKVAELEPDLKKLMELGMDISAADKLVVAISQCISDFDFDNADKYLTEINTLIEDMGTVQAKKIASELFKRTKGIFLRMKEEGIPMEEAKELLKSTMEHIKQKDYMKAIEMSKATEQELDAARDRHLQATTISILDKINELGREARELELETGRIDEMTHRANFKLDSGEFREAKELANDALGELTRMIDAKLLVLIETGMEDLLSSVEGAKEIEADVDEELKAVAHLEELKEKGEYRETLEGIKGLGIDLDRKKDLRVTQLNSQKIYVAANALLNLQDETGWDLDDLQVYLNYAQDSLEKKEYGMVDNYLNEFFSLKTEKKNLFYQDRYKQRLDEIRDEISVIRDVGIDMEGIDERILSVENDISLNRFDELENTLKELIKFTEEARNVKAKELANRNFGQAKKLFLDMRGKGIDLEEEKRAFKRAMKLAKTKKYIDACEAIQSVIEKLETSNDDYLKNVLITEMEKTEEFLDVFNAHGYFSEKTKKELERTRDKVTVLFSNNKFSTAKELMDVLQEKMKEFRSVMKNYDESVRLSKDANELMVIAQRMEIDVKDEMLQRDKADELLASDNLADAVELLTAVKGILEEKIEKRRKENARSSLEGAEKALSDNKAILDDSSPMERLLKDARDLFGRKEYEQVVEVSEELIELVKRTLEKREKEDIERLIEETRRLIEKNEKEGIEIFQSDALYYKARYYFARKEYDIARQYCEEAKENARAYREEFNRVKASKSLDEAFRMLEKSREMELDISSFQERLKHAEQLLEEKEYDRITKITGEIKGELAKEYLEYNRKIYAARLEEFGEFVTYLRSIPHFPEDYKTRVERSLEEMEGLFKGNDFSTLQKKIRIFKDEVSQLKLKIDYHQNAEHLLEKVLEQKEEGIELGMDIFKESNLIKEARLLMERYQFEEVVPLLRRAGSSLGNKIEIARMKRAQTLLKEAVRVVEENRDVIDELPSVENYFTEATTNIEGKKYQEATAILSDIIKRVNEVKETKKTGEISKKLANVEKLMQENEELGIDVSLSKEQLVEARASLDRKSYGLAEKYWNNARESLLKARENHFRKSAYSLLARSQEGLRELVERDVDTKALENLVSDVQQLLGEGEFKRAQGLGQKLIDRMDDTKKRYWRNEIFMIHQRMDELVAKGKKLGLELADVETEIEKSSSLLNEGKYTISFKLAEQSERKLKKMISDRLERNIQTKMSELWAAKDKARNLGLDVSVESDALNTIEEMRKEGKYGEIPDMILFHKVSLDNKIGEHNKKICTVKMNRTLNELAEFQEEAQEEFSDMVSYVELAKKALEKNDFEAVEAFLDEYSRLKESHTREYWETKYRRDIEEAEIEIERIWKTGVSVSPVVKSIDLLKTHVSQLNFQEAKKISAELEAGLENLKNVHVRKRAKYLMGEIDDVFQEMEDTDLDMTKEREMYDRIKELFTAREYIDAVIKADEVKRLVREGEDRYFKEQVSSILTETEDMLAIAAELNLDTGLVGKIVNDCRMHLHVRDIMASMELAQRVREEMKVMLNAKLSQIVDRNFSMFKSKVEEARGIGVDIREEWEILDSINRLLVGQRYREVKDLLENRIGIIDDKITNGRKQKHQKRIDEAKNDLETLENETKSEFKDLQTFIEEALRALERKEFGIVDSRLEEFFKSRERHNDRFRSENYSRQMSKLELEIARIRELGIDCAIGDDLVSSGRESLYRYEFDQVKDILDRVEEFLKDAKSIKARNLAMNLVKNGKEYIRKLIAIDKEVKPATNALKEVIRHMKDGSYLKACESGLRVTKRLEKIYNEHLKSNIASKLAGFREFYKEIERNMNFTPEYKEFVRKKMEFVESTLVENRLDEANNEVMAYEDIISDSRSRMGNFKKSEGLINIADELRKIALSLNIDIKLEQNILAEVNRLKNALRLDEAVPLLTEANESLENKIDLKRMEHANALFQKVISTVEDNEEIVKTIPGMEDLISISKGHLDNKEYESFTKASNKIIDSIADMKQKLLIKEMDPLLINSAQIIERNRNLGIDVSRARSLLNKAKQHLDKKEFEECRKYIKLAEQRAFTDKLGFDKKKASGALAEAWENISKSLESGLDVSEIESLMAKAQVLFREEKFEDAKKTAEEARGMVEATWKKHLEDNISSMLNDIELMVGEGKELGLDVASIEEIAGSCGTLLEEEKLNEAAELAEEAKMKVEMIINAHLSETLLRGILEITSDIEAARNIGVNIEKESNVLVGIKKLKEKEKYREGLALVPGIQTSVKEKILAQKKKNQYEMITDAQNELENLERETGEKYKELHSILFSATDAVKDGNFSAMESHLEKFNKGRMEVSNKFYSNKYGLEIRELETRGNELRELGIDITDMGGSLRSVEKLLSENDIEGVKKVIGRIKELLGMAEIDGAYGVAQSYIKRIDANISELEDAGVDTAEVLGMVEQILGKIDKEEFVEACGMGRKVLERMQVLEEEHTIARVEGARDELLKMIEDGRGLGLDVSSKEAKIPSVRTHLEQKNFEDARNEIQVIRNELEGEVNREVSKRIRAKLAIVDTVIDNARKEGINVDKELELMASIGEMEKDGKRFEILAMLDDVKKSLDEHLEASIKEEILQQIEQAKVDLQTMQDNIGGKLEEPSSKVDEAMKALGEDDIPGVEEALKQFNELKQTYEEQLQRGKFEEELRKLAMDAGELGEFGIDVGAPAQLITETKEKILSADLEEIKYSVSEINSLLEEARTVQAKNIAKEQFTATKKFFTRLNKMKVDLSEGKKLFKEAMLALKKQDYLAGIKLTSHVNDILEKAQDRYYMDTATSSFKDVQRMVDEARRLGMDVTSFDKMIGEIFEHVENDEFQKANKLVEKATQAFIKTREGFFHESTLGLLDELDRMLEEARKIDADTHDIEEMGKQARDLLESEKKEAMELARNGRDALKERIDTTMLGSVQEKMDFIARAVEEAKSQNVDLTEVIKAVSAVESLKAQGKHLEAISYMETIQLSIEKAVEDHRLEEEKRLAEEEKLAEKERLAEEEKLAEKERLAEEEKLAEKERLAEEEKLAEKERLAEEEKLAEEKRKVIEKEVGEDALLVRARNMLEDTQAYIRENEKMSLDVFRLEALMFKAKFAMDNEQYLEVIRYCTEAKDRAADQRKELEEKDLSGDFEAEYEEMTALMEKAKSNGLKLTEEEKAMDSILDLKNDGNFTEGIDKIKVVRDGLDRRLHEEVRLIKIAAIDEAVTELEKLRENTGETHDELKAHLNDAAEALKSEEYVKIDSLLKEFHAAISEYDTEASAGEYAAILENLESEIEKLETAGIDVVHARESIGQAKESLSRSEMGAAKEKLDESRIVIENMKEKELKIAAKERFSEAKEMLALVKDAGLPIAEHKKILQESIKAFRQKDFMKAAMIAIETKSNMMESLEEKDEKDGEDKEKEAMERIAPLREEISEMMVKAKELGLAAESAEDRLDLVRSRLDESKFDDAEEMLMKVKTDLKEMFAREEEGSLDSEMKELASRMKTAKNNDLNIKKEEGFVAKIEKLSKEGKYEDARGMIKKVKGSVENKILKYLYEPRDKQMKEAVEFLVDHQKESDAKGVEELQDLLINARNALEEEEFQRTDSLFEEFKNKREAFTKKSRAEDYGNRIENIHSEIMIIKDLEIDVGDCEDLIVLARKSFERGDIDSRLKKMVSKSEDILAGIRSKQLPEKSKELVSLTEQLIENVETLGADVGRFNSELNEASSAMGESDHIRACQNSIALRNELLEMREKLKREMEREGQREDRERVKPVLDESMALLAEAKAIGLDVGLNADRVELARARFREGKFEGAEELAVVAKKEIEVLIENKLSEKFSKEMEYLTGPSEDEGVGTFDFAALDEADLIERTCPNCRKVGRGKRCGHCGNLMEEPKAEEEDKGPRCEMCSGRLEEEGEKLVCVDCGGEFDMDGKLIIPTEMPDMAEMLQPVVEEEEFDEEMEEMMPVETGTGKVCELCGDELIRSGDLLICELCGVEYTTDGEVSVSGEQGLACELCGGTLEKWGKGMRCPECDAEYNADGNLAIMGGEGVAIGKMISNLESMGDVKIPAATKKKVVRRAIRKAAPAARKPKKALKPVGGKKGPVKKMMPVKKAVPVKKGGSKKVIPKKKSPAKKVVPKKKNAKKEKKGPSWDQLKEAKKKKAKKKGKDIDYERPNLLGMLKKK